MDVLKSNQNNKYIFANSIAKRAELYIRRGN